MLFSRKMAFLKNSFYAIFKKNGIFKK